ncbi:hypothetical protein [Streptomyces sp. E1N211]|uniref:hypothetical protein n=1 Tax=Streptomyces sp. E1N211 TaxID=1851876 RepID=UPI001F4DA2CE|nr:hypothetical protein [Streptomyces sp. E1N211]
MTTFSSSSSNEPGIPVDTAAAPPVGTTGTATGAHRPEPAWARHRTADRTAPADARYAAGADGGTAPPRDPSGTDRTARQADTGHPRDPVHGNHPRDPVDRPREPAGAEGPRDPVATVDLVDPVDTTREPVREQGVPRRLGDVPDPSGLPGAAPGATERVYADPVTDLVHAAVSDRPLEEVVDLITALERSPEHTRAVVDALRAAGVDRSVEDVTRLVALLTRPPRDAASADETIRAAAAHRSVEDVTLLVALLHNEPLAPHCREEALRAAATGRSVDELVELIDRLAAQRPPEHLLRAAVAEAARPAQEAEGQREAHRDPRPEPERAPAGRGSRCGVFASGGGEGRGGGSGPGGGRGARGGCGALGGARQRGPRVVHGRRAGHGSRRQGGRHGDRRRAHGQGAGPDPPVLWGHWLLLFSLASALCLMPRC